MVSKVLNDFLVKLALANVDSLDEKVALQGARQRVIQDAKIFPCYRCENAGWLSTFEAPNVGQDREFFFTLSSCAGGVILPQCEGQAGLQPPSVPFFCSAESQSEGAGTGGLSSIMPSRGRGTDDAEKYPRPRGG